MVIIYILAFVACISSITALVIRNKKTNSISIALSIVGIFAGFIALAIAAPRDMAALQLDYLGFIVAILAVFATLLLAMQLYNVFSVKEDASKVEEARDIIENYASKVEELSNKLEKLSEKSKDLEDEISPLYHSVSDIMEKMKRAVYFVDDGPDDDK